MSGLRSRQWVLRRRPAGGPVDDDVELVVVDVPDPAPGEVLVTNEFLSVEPYMRGRMSEQRSYVEPFELDRPMSGPAVGRVVVSADPALPVGTWVRHDIGWREVAAVPVGEVSVLDVDGLDPAAFLGVLGQTGFTAYVGLLHVGDLQPGETVLVSAAAGAVGTVVAQVARAMGCRVIGSAGSAEKVRFLETEIGLDAAFSYRDGPVRSSLGAALERVGSSGVDVYFDNVGGEQLEAAIRVMNERGRVVLCGAIASYNATEPVPGPRNLLLAIWRRLRLEGFLVGDHADREPAFVAQMSTWLRSGAVRPAQTTFEGGIAQAWPAFLSTLDGGTTGKTVIAVGRER